MGNYLYYQKVAQQPRKYGWVKDTVDERDYFHDFKLTLTHSDIKQVDLRTKCPNIYTQGLLGSRTANAIAAAYEFDELKQNEKEVFTPSRLFIYYNERTIDKDVITDDCGSSLRTGMKTIKKHGVCSEKSWLYDVTKYATKPPQECYDEGQKHKAVEYKRVKQTLEQLKQCLIEGFPIVFGMLVYESFETPAVVATGKVSIPLPTEKCLGGHAMCIVGFDDNIKCFVVRNSWGVEYGDKGYCYIPYDYVLNDKQAGDFWTVKKVTDN